MKHVVVWIDLNKARIFELGSDRTSEKVLTRRELRHHTGAQKEKDNHKNAHAFFKQVAKHLKEADEVLLIGPAGAKTHFQDYLKGKVVAVQTVDHPTPSEIVALGKNFFRVHDKSVRVMQGI